MSDTQTKGNDPQRWERLLEFLDDKLQFGVLDNLRKVSTYHFEDKVLYLEVENPEVERYFSKEPFLQQLTILCQVVDVESVKLRKKPAD
jgi:hypothetical protein